MNCNVVITNKHTYHRQPPIPSKPKSPYHFRTSYLGLTGYTSVDKSFSILAITMAQGAVNFARRYNPDDKHKPDVPSNP